ncbi:MAG: toxin-antitoxin system HicB family antitoxin [Chloroflexi bacterium]|nr:toxin-antitoxin system HicB family antitoxin [Chloroflexota bacterium]
MAPRSFSGRLLVRMPAALHAELADVANEYEISLNRLMVYLLSWGIGKTTVPPDRYLRLKRMFRDLNGRR